MFACAIYLIVMLTQDKTTPLEKVLYIGLITYWILSNYKIVLGLLIISLIPLFLLILCVFCCVGIFKAPGQRQVSLPSAFRPTNQQIINSGGTCSICMMDFSTSDNVLTLSCSDKHMFHQLCINGWINVRNNCPICRADIG